MYDSFRNCQILYLKLFLARWGGGVYILFSAKMGKEVYIILAKRGEGVYISFQPKKGVYVLFQPKREGSVYII
jgi:hypothetical protein